MTTGIYALSWDSTDAVYIGLSNNIEGRYKSHIRTLKNSVHDNFKVQSTFYTYGLPKLVILEECSSEMLGERELLWIAEFDNVLNIIEGGDHSYGTKHTTSKYSKAQILKVLSLLYRTNLSYTEVAARTKVGKVSVASIAAGRTHAWLSGEYPDEYKQATRSRSGNTNSIQHKNKGIKRYWYTFISPQGVEYERDCISEFCREVDEFSYREAAAKQGFSKIIHGTKSDYFGWKCIRHSL